MTTRSLSRPIDISVPAMGSGTPHGTHDAAREERLRLRDYFLDTIGVKPDKVESRIDRMTLAERVYAEIDMLREAKVMHSYDYDPLAPGRY